MTGYESKKAAAQDKITDEQGRPMTYWGGKAQPALEPNWVCNECGAQEFTSALSEADLDYLACSTCGGNEFHKEALAQLAQGPVAFEEWLSKQHGDPEEIGILQALRIAYISGQDSITTPHQRKPLTDDDRYNLIVEHLGPSALTGGKMTPWDIFMLGITACEAAHGIKENNNGT